MKKVVVIGAGIGGLPMAFELRDLLRRKAEITVVSDSDWFHFVPSNPGSPCAGGKPTTSRFTSRPCSSVSA